MSVIPKTKNRRLPAERQKNIPGKYHRPTFLSNSFMVKNAQQRRNSVKQKNVILGRAQRDPGIQVKQRFHIFT